MVGTAIIMKLVAAVIVIASIVAGSDSPVQVHVALGSNPGTITFTWSTRYATPTTYVRIASGSSWLYYQGTTRNFKDSTNAWVIHSVTVQLNPDIRYQYQVGCQVNGFSSSLTLLVPSDQAPANFLLFGDLSTAQDGADSWTDMTDNVKDYLIQAMIHVGDLAYDLSSKSSTVGDDFMATIQPTAHYVPYMICAGNHEAKDNYYNYLQRFDMPNNKYYYTFTIGYVRFLAIHTEAFLSETDMIPSMMSYIKSVLNRNDEDKAAYPWLIVFGHRPMYCSSKAKADACGPEADVLKQYLEPLFTLYGVDLYINGHVHNYQRTAPVYQGIVTSRSSYGDVYMYPKSPIYITTGGPGSDDTNSKIDWTDAPDWLIAGEEDFSFSILNIYNQTHLYWEQQKTKNNKITDAFWVVK